MAIPIRVFALATALALLSAYGHAAPTASEIAVARALFDEGAELQKEGDFAAAARKYREAASIKDTPGLRYRIGFCEAEQGRLVEAKVEYERARELIQKGIPAPDVESLLPDALAELGPRIPELTIAVADPGGVRLKVDGKPIARAVLGKAMPVNPGAHRIEARARAHTPKVVRVTLEEGERQTVDVRLEPLRAKERAAPAESSVGSPGVSARDIALASGAALTLGGLAVGVGYRVEVGQEARRAREATAFLDNPDNGFGSNPCSDPNEPEPAAACTKLAASLEGRSQAEDRALYGFVAAGTAAALTTVAFFVWPSDEARVTARVGPGEAFVGLAGHW